MPSSAEVEGVTITHPDRVIYADAGVTKLEVAQYFHRVAGRLLPHVEGRPLSVVRCPTGLDAPARAHGIPQNGGRGPRGGTACFFQKHANATTPRAIGRVPIREAGKMVNYLSIDDERGLLSLAQFGVLELHPWGARADRPDAPDRMFFDLDPGEGVDWKAIVHAAKAVRERLEARDLVSFVKTTGGKGLHVVVPLAPRHDWEEVRAFSRGIAEAMAKEEPDRYVATMALRLRPGKIFIDYLRNARGATAVAAYSTRARPGATVSLPIAWNEVDKIRPDAFDLRNLPKRLSRREPWADFFDLRQKLPRRAPPAARAAAR